MANPESAKTPLLSDDDLERSDSFEHIAYSDSDSTSLSGSTVYNDPPVPEGKGATDLGAEADTKSLPEYTEYGTTHLEKGAADDVDVLLVVGVGGHQFIFLFGLFSFFVTRMCVKHRRAARPPVFSNHSPEDLQAGREIILDTGSSAVYGRYPLYDLLYIKTTSGSVNIIVDPQPADPKKPDEPARLIIETEAGSVSAAFLQYSINTIATFENGDTKKVDNIIDLDYLKTSGATSISQVKGQIPYRPYEVEIKTQSGSINGRFVFTTSASLETQSGHISASFVPVVSPDEVVHATLTTETVSGGQDISVGEPLIIDASDKTYPAGTGEMSTSSSSHTSQSGSLQVKYPHSWAGHVEAFTQSGWIALGGDGLEVTEQTHGHAVGVKNPDSDNKRHGWWGSRGDMDVVIESTGSGSVQFYVKDGRFPVEESEDFEVYILDDN
ncbi:hypothetical protein TCE0_034r10551 [Talaromyces pinophilus]|uniref:Uncharacterized protein n=1 Tax=Talaromyces pinophilus TaxID=128442 RepID=A0A6V8HCI9_TALPI|nr:hypothetical protein TCE0_034r10551 [Talaromyces pinophilus]